MVTRAVAEARGGRIIRDVSGGIPGYLAQMSEQKLLAPLKGALHPNTALLWARWAISGERQKIYAQAGETPAHPKVEPTEKTRPATVYMIAADEVKEFSRYEKLWKEVFQLR